MTNCNWFQYRWQKGNSRYYKAIVHKDMLGDWVVTIAWGGLHSRLGNLKHYPFSNKKKADEFLHKISQRRKQRGYIRLFLS